MDKKSLKWYEAPAMELINVNVEGALLNASAEDVSEDEEIL